jgi:hypothetical protein
MFARCLVLALFCTISTARAQEPAPSPAAAPVEETVPRPAPKWGWAFAGATVGAFVIGAGLGGAALARASEQNGNPASPAYYTQDLANRANEGKTLANTAYAFFGIGAALAVVDAIIWFEVLRKPQVKRRESAALRLTPAGVRF